MKPCPHYTSVPTCCTSLTTVILLFYSPLQSSARLLHFFHPYPRNDSVPLLHCWICHSCDLSNYRHTHKQTQTELGCYMLPRLFQCGLDSLRVLWLIGTPKGISCYTYVDLTEGERDHFFYSIAHLYTRLI